MDQISLKDYSKYFFIVAFIGVIVLSFFLINPFMSSILASLILAYIFHPVYVRVNKILKNKNLSSFLMIILVTIIIIVPLVIAFRTIINEVLYLYTYFNLHSISELIPSTVKDIIPGYVVDLNLYIDRLVEAISPHILNAIPNFFLYLPVLLLNFFIVVFIMFFLFRDGDNLVKHLKEYLPMRIDQKEVLFKRLGIATHAIVYGHILTALIQGVVGTLGFVLLGIKSPLVWGLIMTIFALIPFVGTPIVWIPVGLVQIITGNVFTGIGVLIYGALIISSIDNIVKPKITGSKARVHPVLILLGVVGGLKMFGFIGFIVGPLILTALIIFLDLHAVTKSEV